MNEKPVFAFAIDGPPLNSKVVDARVREEGGRFLVTLPHGGLTVYVLKGLNEEQIQRVEASLKGIVRTPEEIRYAALREKRVRGMAFMTAEEVAEHYRLQQKFDPDDGG